MNDSQTIAKTRKHFLSQSLSASVERNRYTDLSRAGLDSLQLAHPAPAIISAEGATILPLSDARAEPLLSQLLSQRPSSSSNKYFSLAKASAAGAFVLVDANTTATIKLSYPQTAPGTLAAFFTLFSIGAGASVAVLEENRLSFPHVLSTEAFVGDGALLQYSSILAPSSSAPSLSQRRFFVGANASVTSLTGAFGGSLCKSVSEAVLAGDGAVARDHAACFASGNQHFDLTSNLHHAARATKGSAVMRGVLRDSGRAVFWGNIRIEPGAKGADAYLSQNALLLNPGARADAMPTLEIEEADVRATHSSSVTHADESALFYLASRGIPKPEAKKTLASSFIEAVAERANDAAATALLEAEVSRKWLTPAAGEQV